MVSNARVDPRLDTIGSGSASTPAAAGPSRKGAIVSRDGASVFTFHYNPSEVDVSHAVDFGSDPALGEDVIDPNDPSQYTAPSNAGVSFDLLLDRTYEVWKGDRNNVNTYHQGVWEDISVLYQMLGIATDGQAWNLQFMKVRQFWVLFGGVHTNNRAMMQYYGFFTSVRYQLTHWSFDMVPTRATVHLELSIMPFSGDATQRARATAGYTGAALPTVGVVGR